MRHALLGLTLQSVDAKDTRVSHSDALDKQIPPKRWGRGGI